MSTGDKIRMLRENRGITQEDLAKKVGYKSRSSIAKIETGDSDPSQRMLLKIATALDVSPAELDTARRQLTTAMEMLERRVYSEDDYLQRRAVLQQKITAAQDEITRLESDTPTQDTDADIIRALPQIRHILDAWPYAATPADQNSLLRSVLSRVDFQKTGPLLRNQNPRDHMEIFLHLLHTPTDE